VEILAVVPAREAIDAMLDGWQDAMTGPNSIAWVRDRVANPPAPRAGDGHDPEGSAIEVPGAHSQD
jgi:hypothetical protein